MGSGTSAACVTLLVLAVSTPGARGQAATEAPAVPPPSARDPGSASVRVERETLAMGTRLSVELRAADRAAGLRAADAALAAVRRYEDVLSTWRDDTDLARLNRSPVGARHALPDPLASVLERAVGWSSETGGAFAPAVGPLVRAWGLREGGRIPGSAELRRARAASGDAAFRFDFTAGTAVRLDSAAWIDAGAFGKGAALDAARSALRERGVRDALLDFGGQVLALGGPSADADGWSVAVAHPDARRTPAARLRLRGATASTTASSERGVVVDGRRLSHVLDPRTGRPAPDWGSVTVVARDALAADAVSTALFVLGPEAGMAWARARDDLGVLFLVREEDGGLDRRWNRAMEAWLERDRGTTQTSRTSR